MNRNPKDNMTRFAATLNCCLALLLAGTVANVYAATDTPVNPSSEGEVLPLELTIGKVIELTYRHNPALRESREKLREQQGRMTSTGSVRLPALDAFGNYQVEDQSRLQSFGGSQDDTSWSAGVEVTQPLYAGGSLNAQIQSQRESGQALLRQVEATQINVLADAFEKFYDALLAREQIKVQQESLDLLKQQLELANNRYQAGSVPRFDVLQAEVRVANAQPPLIRARNRYRVAIEDLRATLGLPYPEGKQAGDVTLEGSWITTDAPLETDALVETALSQRPELAELQHQQRAVEYDLKQSTAQRQPRVNALANYTVLNDRFSEDGDNLEGWLVGVQATMPLWEGGRIRGEVVQAKSRLEQVKLREQELMLSIEVEVRQAISSVEEAREILDAAELTIEQATEAVRLADNRYQAGGITQLDVLSSQLELTRAKLEQITAARDYQIQLVRLYRAIGNMPGQKYLDDADRIELPTF